MTGGPPRISWHAVASLLLVAVLFVLPLYLAARTQVAQSRAVPDLAPGTPVAALVRSLVVAGAAAALATLIGAAVAFALVLTDLPASRLWGMALLFPFLCPPMVYAMANVYGFGAGGWMDRVVGGLSVSVHRALGSEPYLPTILTLAEIGVPLVILVVGRGMARVERSMVEAARLMCRRGGGFRLIVGLLRGDVAVGFLFVWLVSLGNFAVPHVMQCPLYPMEIYVRIANYLDYAGAVRIALPLVAATAVLVIALGLLDWRLTGKAPLPRQPADTWRLGRLRVPVLAAVGLYLVPTTVLPLAAIVYECREWRFVAAAWREAAPDALTSLVLAASAAAGLCAAGWVVSHWIAKAGRWGGLAYTAAIVGPFGVPAMILAIGYVRLFNRVEPVNLAVLYDSPWPLVLGIALVARWFPFGARALTLGRAQLAPAAMEAARLAGVSPARRLMAIELPMLGDYLATAAVVVFVLTIGETEMSFFLVPPGTQTLSLRLFSFLHTGPQSYAAALAMLSVLLAAAPAAIYYLLTDRWLRVL